MSKFSLRGVQIQRNKVMKKLLLRKEKLAKRQRRFAKRNASQALKNKQSKAKKRIDEKRIKKSNARYTTGRIDSLNINSTTFSSLFICNENYYVERLKTQRSHDVYRCKELFGKSFLNKTKSGKLVCPFREIDAIHCYTGVVLPMKLHVKNKNSPTVEFAGLARRNKREDDLKSALLEIAPYAQDGIIKRIDIAIDVDIRIQSKVHKALARTRVAERYKNSIYYKTPNEGKRNPIVNIVIYDKGKKEGFNLDKKLIRMEFQFSSGFFPKITLRNIDKAIMKIEKRMKKDTGLNIKVQPLL